MAEKAKGESIVNETLYLASPKRWNGELWGFSVNSWVKGKIRNRAGEAIPGTIFKYCRLELYFGNYESWASQSMCVFLTLALLLQPSI